MRVITLEDHFSTPAYRQLLNRPVTATLAERSRHLGHDIAQELDDLGERRIAAMDAAGIDLQVVSLTAPGTHAFEGDTAIRVAAEANECLRQAIDAHPDRLAGFAAIPSAVPEAAARELERCVKDLGFKGALVNGHVNGEFLDDRRYWPIFECAAHLQVPIYLHPTMPHPGLMQSYLAGYPELSTAAWGFAIDASCNFLRLMMAGVFDQFPGLTIILGHMGEGLPFGMHRLHDHLLSSMAARKLRLTPTDYLRQNLVITTSGNWSVPSLLCSLLTLGADRIMFSVDWPFESNKVGAAFLSSLPLGEDDLHKIAHANAERVLSIRGE